MYNFFSFFSFALQTYRTPMVYIVRAAHIVLRQQYIAFALANIFKVCTNNNPHTYL